MLKRARAAAMLAACLFAQPLTAAAPLMLEPTGPWTYPEVDGTCNARRTFGSGEQAVVLVLSKFGPTRHFKLSAAGHPLRLRKRASISLRFEPDQTSHVHPEAWIGVNAAGAASFMVTESLADTQERRRRGGNHLSPEGDPNGLGSFWPPSEEQREAQVDRLTFSGPIEAPVTLHLGSMREPMAALRRCLEKSLTSWGVDLAVQSSIVRTPQPVSVGRWLRVEDYPGPLWKSHKSGIVRLRLLIDRQGMPTDCLVVNPNPPEEFNRVTCSLMLQRARFKPAMVADGQPVESVFFVEVNWLY